MIDYFSQDKFDESLLHVGLTRTSTITSVSNLSLRQKWPLQRDVDPVVLVTEIAKVLHSCEPPPELLQTAAALSSLLAGAGPLWWWESHLHSLLGDASELGDQLEDSRECDEGSPAVVHIEQLQQAWPEI